MVLILKIKILKLSLLESSKIEKKTFVNTFNNKDLAACSNQNPNYSPIYTSSIYINLARNSKNANIQESNSNLYNSKFVNDESDSSCLEEMIPSFESKLEKIFQFS